MSAQRGVCHTPRGQTDACENIAMTQTSFADGKDHGGTILTTKCEAAAAVILIWIPVKRTTDRKNGDLIPNKEFSPLQG